MMRIFLLTLLANTAVVIPICDAFTFRHNNHHSPSINNYGKIFQPADFPTIFKASSSNEADNIGIANTVTTTHETTLAANRGTRQSSKRSRLRNIFRKNDDARNAQKLHRFTYDYDEMIIGNTSNNSDTTTAIMLIHPIGVGIGKWYYDRLLHSLQDKYGDIGHRLVFLSPDLLGSATASGPTDENGESILKFPLLNVTDWTEQVTQLMAEYETKSEEEGHLISNWSIVANGGCSPIALQVAASSTSSSLRRDEKSPFKAAVTNVILSSPPRLPFFLESTDPIKVRKSYRTLSGISGKLFWWYALRKNGKFIRTFSEKNLVGDAANLGEEWTPNCLKAARLHGGRSRYPTFAFLAGTLQDGCAESLNKLKNESGAGVMIDFIRGGDKRRNRARSWFWTRKKTKADGDEGDGEDGAIDDVDAPVKETIQQYVYKNGNRGKELFVGGRISLAWEDSGGYAKSVMELLCE